MAAQQSAIINWSQYLALRAVTGFMQCFDIEQNLSTAASVGSLFYRFNRKRRKRAQENIALSFPDWPVEKVKRVAERSMQHMFKLFMVESFVTPRLIAPTTWASHVRLGEVGPLMDLMVRGQPAIFVTGHFGNWELLGATLAAIGYPLIALARPLDNPLINKWLLDVRQVRGLRIITKWGATPILQDALRNHGRVAFIADQNAGNQGLFVPFFGRLASSYKSIGLLAMRYKVPIIAGCALRMNDRFQYDLSYNDIIWPQEWASAPDPLFYITARYNRAIEQMVRQSPEQYLWLHRRWKSRPKHEREHQPMPNRLIAKLQELPWMTQDELSRLVNPPVAPAID
ncbi:MAG: lysophospholipid acyltransferase family protein [Phycisphaerales bacterium]|nr:lysophospholipid acyltransferase family protein [Phycisphaerales bacterium]MCI0631990.1 lysophospholipid acyltransferase family protein [Phycisphaerales bacterium]MCI0676947.1 lysophospholipid acyltransferase family protein [Phycisphaerales bacterium]